MHVRSIHVRGFFGHADTTVELPERGVVLVTGLNGAGKSGLTPEAVAWAGWGETIRGTPPWIDGTECLATISTWTGLTFTRTRTQHGRGKLEVEGAPAGANSPKAAEQLHTFIGPFDLWERAATFSSADIGTFARSTDKQRKLLLETMLGHERFDDAHAACLKDLRVAEKALAKKQNEHDMAAAKAANAVERLAEIQATLTAHPPPVDLTGLREEVAQLGGLLSRLRDDIDTSHHVSSKLEQQMAAARQAAEQLEVRIADASRQVCPTCEQVIETTHGGRLVLRLGAEKSGHESARASDANLLALTNGDRDSMFEDQKVLRGRERSLERELSRLAAVQQEHARQRSDGERSRVGQENALSAAQGAVALAENELKQLTSSVAELTAAERVLGLYGPRATLLAGSLSGIESIANAWLNRIAPGIRLGLKPFVENASGALADRIGLDIEGAGAGHGYKAASAGQRRRIDIALLLALGELAAGASVATPGTLFFDEVFDAIDSASVPMVLNVLTTLAQDRAVVVISHSAELAGALQPVRHYHVANGAVL